MRCFSILCPETANPVLKPKKKKGVPVILANERCVEMRNYTLVQEYCWCPASGHNSPKDSATGTRARIVRVRAEYPNQLDYTTFGCEPSAGRKSHMVTRGLEPRTLRLLAIRSNQLSYETPWCAWLPSPKTLLPGGAVTHC